MNPNTNIERKKRNPLVFLLICVWYVAIICSSIFLGNTIIRPELEKRTKNSEEIPVNGKAQDISNQNVNKGLRTAKLTSGFKEIPKSILSEVVYKDVRIISTKERPFRESEITLIKLILDVIPQKLFDYRPWAIISTSFDDNDVNIKVNPGTAAYTSGPYVFVSDITFNKRDGYDIGSYRGTLRVLSHEFVHTAQFFETQSIPDKYISSYLEESDLVRNWVSKTGWSVKDNKWVLAEGQLTTDYGKSTPIEDMADSVGNMVVGDDFVISKSRSDWILIWLGLNRDTLFKGTLPLNFNIKQRKVEASDQKLLDKYRDSKAFLCDVVNFQSTETKSVKDMAQFYSAEFQRRGWTGSINTNGTGELWYQNRIKVNLEIDKNPLRVTTFVMNVY